MLDKEAYDKSKKVLDKGFDTQAYIVNTLATIALSNSSYDGKDRNIDRVLDSNIDEHIEGLQDEFVIYIKNKKKYRSGAIQKDELIAALNKFLKQSKKIISEVYAGCDLEEEQKAVKDFLFNIINKYS